MIKRSTTMPNSPTVIGAITSMETHKFIPACVGRTVAYPPSIRNSPWAKLMTLIMPKMIASPIEISARLAIAYRTWITTTAAKSMTQLIPADAPAEFQSVSGWNCVLVSGFLIRSHALFGFVGFTCSNFSRMLKR